jgi:serine/threonine protein kinase
MAKIKSNGKLVSISDASKNPRVKEILDKLGVADSEKILNCLHAKEASDSRRLKLKQEKIVEEKTRERHTLDESILSVVGEELGSDRLQRAIHSIGNLPTIDPNSGESVTDAGTLGDLAPEGEINLEHIPEPRLGGTYKTGTLSMDDIISDDCIDELMNDTGDRLYCKTAIGVHGTYMLVEPKGSGGFAAVWKVLRYMEQFTPESLKRSIIHHIIDRKKDFKLRQEYIRLGMKFFNCSEQELLTKKKRFFRKFLESAMNKHEKKGELVRVAYLTRPFATKEYALKVATNSDAETHFKRFQREADFLGNLTKLKGLVRKLTGKPLFGAEHLINSYGFYRVIKENQDSAPAYLMEMMPFSLDDLEFEDPVKDCVEMVYQVAKGLHLIHKFGYLHRDVKPSNIMINKRGQAVLTDLGLIKLDAKGDNIRESIKLLTQLSKKGDVMGSIGFMSPEQAYGDEVDARSDLYSLAATLYYKLSGNNCHYDGVRDCDGPQAAYLGFLRAVGKLPNLGGKCKVAEIVKPTDYNPDISEELEKVLIKALQVDKEKRYQSAEEFMAALEPFR